MDAQKPRDMGERAMPEPHEAPRSDMQQAAGLPSEDIDAAPELEQPATLGLGDRARSKLNRRTGTVDAIDEHEHGRTYGLHYDEEPQDKYLPLPNKDGAALPPDLIERE